MIFVEGVVPRNDFFALGAEVFDEEFGWIACAVVERAIVKVDLEKVGSIGV
ncbi:hypothetical protein [Chamaesiphon sp.]|uniref:hypothetical protein n=1 Tax=Chamaesiphon sp. TaxID=2814140 RepID=UPI0035933C64